MKCEFNGDVLSMQISFTMTYNEKLIILLHKAALIFMQIVGPVSFRVDSGIAIDLKNHKWPIQAQDPIFAVEYALQVLGSAKAVAWCCPKRQEFMVELRFYET